MADEGVAVELPNYVSVEAWMLIKAADEMAVLINRLWQQHRAILQQCADATGRPMHQAIPGLPMVEPTPPPPPASPAAGG